MKNAKIMTFLFCSSVPFLQQCKDKEEIEMSDIYPIPSCPSEEYYDGQVGSCVAKVAGRGVENFGSYRDVDFNDRKARLEAFISAYFAQESPDLSLTTAPNCTEELEYAFDINEGFYLRNTVSFNCAFTLTQGTDKVLDYKIEPVTQVTAAAGSKPKVPESRFLKVVHQIDTDAVKLMECGYGAFGIKTDENDGKYDPKVSTTEFTIRPADCVDLGTRDVIPNSLRGKVASVIAFPASFNLYLRGERKANTVGGEKIYAYANAQVGTVNQLALQCGGTAFNLPVTLQADADTPKKGTIAFGTVGDGFFASTTVQGADGFDYIKARQILGCKNASCLGDKAKPTYEFFGNYLVVKKGTARDVWRIVDGTGTLAFGSRDQSGNAVRVCDFTYTNSKS
jgi:hypothetical protein